MFSVKRLTIAALIALIPSLTVAEVVVSHFEPLQRIQLNQTDKTAQSFGPQDESDSSTSLRFDALGKSFELLLQSNDRVVAEIAADLNDDGIRVYRGKLAGNPDSWARIVVFNNMPSGVFWDGAEMFAIEVPNDSTVATDTPVVFRMSDVHIAAGTMSCGSGAVMGSAATIVKGITSASKAAIARGPGAVSEITLSAIGDFEFTDARGGDSAAAAALMTRLNNVDGYFSEQVGVQITVPNPVETHGSSGDPFSDTTDSSTLLDELSEYRLQNAVHSNQGLTHLWTGRDLDGSTVGVAWEGALCENYFGAGLSEGNDSALIDSLIAAHEIGHNFGAEHDGEAGTSCADTAGMFIMSPSVNGSERFSDCSIDVMQTRAATAACVTALPTVDVGIKPVDPIETVFLGMETTLEYEVSSNGLVNAPGVAADFTLPAFVTFDSATSTLGTCTNGAGTVDCDIGEVVGLSFQRVTLTFTPNGYGTGTLFADVSTTDPDERSGNDQHQLQLVVDDPVDLVADVPTAGSVLEDETTTVSATLRNISDADASEVTLRIDLQPGIRADSADWSLGSCTVTAQRVDCDAAGFPAQSTANLTVSITALSRGRRDVTLTLGAFEADIDPANNTIVGEVVVTRPDDGGNDEGGGAANPLLLLFSLIVILTAVRRRQ